ncbi:hypothetical protein O181_027007 [Austropuccinia psidii MF-1]|uniref:Integrase catalytic domain-containing protein n=1 Tax=Austropuccinia psidii MF-1 TaxID=1389203 RepID=A0A9Q3CRR0_9BASI|nr:hypothetical protein [Austropuccinia psidii MF-1]
MSKIKQRHRQEFLNYDPKPRTKIPMDWVTALLPGGDMSFNACLVLVDRYSKTPMFLPCHKDDTAMDTDIITWNRVISHTGFFQNIISGIDPKFTLALWTNLHNVLGQSYHSQQLTTPKQMV